MANSKKTEELKETLEKEKQYIEDRYSQVLDTLEYERDRIQNELRREFRTAPRYVRANPEIGVGAAFAGGILAGVVLSVLIKK
jgi:ElaB/YqjD/DUF883 family membrane-anchored ribosome-binding protein